MNTCENCGRPVIPTDTTCWHCGNALPRQTKQTTGNATGSRDSARQADRLSQPAATRHADYDLQAIAIYGALTFMVIIILLAIMLVLGRYPILVRSASLALGSDWMAVTDAELRYTLSLPDDWQWLDLAYRDQGVSMPSALGRQPYVNQALRPLRSGLGDIETIAAALETTTLEDIKPKPFVIVGRSELGRTLTPQEVLDLATNLPLAVTDQTIDRRLTGQPQARYSMLDLERGFQCHHLYVAESQNAAYLVAACAPQDRFASVHRDLDNILDSFQLLQH